MPVNEKKYPETDSAGTENWEGFDSKQIESQCDSTGRMLALQVSA